LRHWGARSGALPAGLTAGFGYGLGAAIPLALMKWLPLDDRLTLTFITVLIALGLTGWLAAWLTRLPVLRLVRRNVLLGSVTMVIGLLAGYALH
jgi:vacuolar iron transporter family protein